MSKTWNYIQKNRLVSVFNLIVVLILILPYSETRQHNFEKGGLSWQFNFVFAHLELIVPYLPILFLTILYQILKNQKLKNIVFGLLILLSCIYSAGAFFSLGFLAQDYTPSIGNFLMILIGPISLWVGITNKQYLK